MPSSLHYSDTELSCKCCGVNACTRDLVDALEALRDLTDARPVIVASAYRCPAHNEEVGGAPESEHIHGIAADVRVNGIAAADLYNLALRVPAFAAGGIGIDEAADYVHVDVRPNGPARWGYDSDGIWEARADLQQDPYGVYPGTVVCPGTVRA